MAGRYKPYFEYKDSGIEWLGAVPLSWSISRLAYIFTKSNAGEVIDKSHWGDGDEILYTCNRTPLVSDFEGFPQEKRTGRNDLLLTRNGTPYVHKPVVNAIYSNVVQRISLSEDFDRDYLALCLGNSAANLKGYGVSIESLNFDNWKTLSFAYPDKENQIKIVSFLDRETGKIDTLIEKQQQLIQLLKEKRQAVISHAVTKGLNPNAKMCDSGVEWLGHVPEHWDVSRIGLLFTESNTRAFSDIELGYPVLSVSIHHGISDKELNEEELDRKVTRSEDRSLYKIVHSNDLAYNMMRAWQGGFGASRLSGLVSPAYVVCKPKTLINSYYFELVLRTENAIVELKKYSRGITDFRLRLYWDEFKNIRVPVPGNDELDEILNHISGVNSTYDNLIIVAGRQIELLPEFIE